MKSILVKSIGLASVAFAIAASSTVSAASLDEAINGDHRTAQEKARDEFRHPKATLEFFGFKPDMTVAEISPGGGWYAKILAPALKDSGTYIAAHFDPEAEREYFKRALANWDNNFVKRADVYGNFVTSVFAPPAKVDFAEPSSVDMVLTFRNVHSWYGGGGEEALDTALNSFYKALKPGGVLGLVAHRLPESMDQAANQRTGYVKQSIVIKHAEKAGFKLVASSEINANPKDKAGHPNGVWTLPPSLRADDADKEKYRAIGESDRMTLKFVKPAAQ